MCALLLCSSVSEIAPPEQIYKSSISDAIALSREQLREEGSASLAEFDHFVSWSADCPPGLDADEVWLSQLMSPVLCPWRFDVPGSVGAIGQ